MAKNNEVVYKRILLKLSGQVVQDQEGPFSIRRAAELAKEIKQLHSMGVETGVVVGGGNVLRGRNFTGREVDRNRVDYMGMLATVINALFFESILESSGVPCVVQSALEIAGVAGAVELKKTKAYLEEKKAVLFAGGTGNPYFTTDTAAAMRGCQIHADALLKGTRVDGVYDTDPESSRKAVLYKYLTYNEVLNRNLKVMDTAAVSMCREQNIPIIVFNVHKSGNIVDIVQGKEVGTIVKE